MTEVIEESEEEFFEEEEKDSSDLKHDIRVVYRLLRKKWSAFLREHLKKNFSQILYVTLEGNYADYILSFQKQYPDKKFSVVIPLFEISNGMEKTRVSFEYFCRNKKSECILYKLPQNENNIQVYGIYSPLFSLPENKKDINNIKYLIPFLKCVRMCLKFLKPDLVHADKIPFFAGNEFEKASLFSTKVLQTVGDIQMYNAEPFWAFVNIADKQSIKKLSRDKIIRKNISALFNVDIFNDEKMSECLEYIYNNYMEFRLSVDSTDNVTENAIFRRLNLHTLKLFPQIKCLGEYYNPWIRTLKRADFCTILSKSYYNEVFKEEDDFVSTYAPLKEISYKISYTNTGFSIKEGSIKYPFDSENFRETREKNKYYLLKEFSKERVNTKFVDSFVLNNDECKIKGYLDSFYKAPLIFVPIISEKKYVNAEISVMAILKLLELNKNVQIILQVQRGTKNQYITSFEEFLEGNSSLDGRWISIEGDVNLPQIAASSDILLLPYLENYTGSIHVCAIKYGCIPVVSKNGLLDDDVVDIFDNMVKGYGFKTEKPLYGYNSSIYAETVLKAVNFYAQNTTSWNLLIKNCIEAKLNWSFKSLEKFNKFYDELI